MGKKMEWTDKQIDVIKTRGRNILVSAAAGSGKTAVLVERIIRLITDEENPVNIDELLVVTFTRAAASEMKTRVRNSLEELSSENPTNENLQRQLSYIHNAKITTIDSFCTSVVKDHFEKIDLDPNYRIGDEIEFEMLKADVIDEMLEEYYEEADEDFMALAEQYASGKSDDNIPDLISSLYHYATGHYNPDRWLDQCSRMYDVNSASEMMNTPLFTEYLKHIRLMLHGIAGEVEAAVSILRDNGQEKAAETLENIGEILKNVSLKEDYYALKEALQPITNTGNLSFSKDVNPEIKQWAKDLKTMAVKTGKGFLNDELGLSIDEMYDEIVKSRRTVQTIIRLTRDFMKRYNEQKKEKGIADFTDQAHMALCILNVEDEDGNLIPSDVARKMSRKYKEIMIDEYQDSNYIQEAILSAVSGGFGRGNMFMVGDVKQSIYRFRQAEPKLFLEKFDKFSDDLNAENVRIILDKNFRSRKEIIDSVNFLFDDIMYRELGGIDYKSENRLVQGAKFDEAPDGQDNRTELIMIGSENRDDEAEFIAQKIKEITDPERGMKITEDGEHMRPVKYGDIAILMRNLKNVSDTYQEHLQAHGISSYAENKSGYYQTMEVQGIVNFLSAIDNPLKDIPLAATMAGPMFGFTSEELAVIRASFNKECLYESLKLYASDGEDDSLKIKINDFLDMLWTFRDMVPYTSVYELINEILKKTGYEHYIKSMVNGKKRYLNIEILKEKAVGYDEISYKGLFNFIRYIERIKDMKKDEGEISLEGEFENTVRIMSIHKSKGLQFPIVFLCEAGYKNSKRQNQIVVDDEGNIGVDCIDHELRTKTQTSYKKAISVMNDDERTAEELRVLYVALTRAKEKLFITARDSEVEKTALKYALKRYDKNEHLSYSELAGTIRFLNWIGNAVGKNMTFDDIMGEHEFDGELTNAMYNEDSAFKVSVISEEQIKAGAIIRELDEGRREEALHILGQVDLSDDERKQFDRMVHFEYPYSEYISMHSKASVTELKKQSMAYEEEQDGHAMYMNATNKEQDEPVPDFAKTGSDVVKSGAGRGTAYHRVFELLDMTPENYSEETVAGMIDKFVADGLLETEDAKCINPEDIVAFTKTSLFERMKNAYTRDELYRERKFLMGIPASETIRIFSDNGNQKIMPDNFDDTMIIQGIIDVCFLEDGKYILADYKTDRVSNMQELVEKYHVQLESYKQAIEQISKIPVSEMIIYSVTLNEEITI